MLVLQYDWSAMPYDTSQLDKAHRKVTGCICWKLLPPSGECHSGTLLTRSCYIVDAVGESADEKPMHPETVHLQASSDIAVQPITQW